MGADPDFPANVSDIVGVSDGFVARGESMWHSADGMSWQRVGAVPEGTMLPWRDGALIAAPGERMVRWTAEGGDALPMTAGLPVAARDLPPVGTGPLGLVAIGSSDVLFTPDGSTWSLRPMPEAMYDSGGSRRSPTIAVGDDAALVLTYSAEESTPSLWLGTPEP